LLNPEKIGTLRFKPTEESPVYHHLKVLLPTAFGTLSDVIVNLPATIR
jgi:hypothetical protein